VRRAAAADVAIAQTLGILRRSGRCRRLGLPGPLAVLQRAGLALTMHRPAPLLAHARILCGPRRRSGAIGAPRWIDHRMDHRTAPQLPLTAVLPGFSAPSQGTIAPVRASDRRVRDTMNGRHTATVTCELAVQLVVPGVGSVPL